MRRLAADRQMAFEIAVEWNAVAEQVEDPVRGLRCHHADDRLIDDAVTGDDRVMDMAFDRITGAHSRGNAGLRPGRGRAAADRRRRQNGHRLRRQLERAEQPGKAAADDDHIVRSPDRLAADE
jgi:hypothetical protein